jgi:hypothetical protein
VKKACGGKTPKHPGTAEHAGVVLVSKFAKWLILGDMPNFETTTPDDVELAAAVRA